MKKFWKCSVPAILALILILIPCGTVFAEDPADPAGANAVVTEDAANTDASANEAGAADSTAQEPDYYNHVWPTPPETDSESAFIMENSTSMVLYEKAADEKRYPASTTKILTALLAIENCSLDEMVTFSESAITLEEAATNIDAQAGEQMPLRDVLYGLMLASGNDCANAIAEHVAGSVPAFAEMMNARAAEIGCTNTHFVNPHGLFDADHYTTARDLALIAQEAFKNSTFVEIIREQVYYAGPTNMDDTDKKFSNWDLLLDPESEYYDPDVIGGKTGFLDEAGRCLVSFAQRDGFTVILVQLKGAYTGIFAEAKELLDYTFNSFSMKNIAANERRFSGAVEHAKVVLDPSAQVLTLNAIPFDQLESELTFAEDLSVERKADLQIAASEENGRSLYAVIDYRYADHDLGSVNVYLDPSLEIAPASFIQVFYISPLWIVVFVIFILVITLVFFAAGKQKKKLAAAPAAYTNRRNPAPKRKAPSSGNAARRTPRR